MDETRATWETREGSVDMRPVNGRMRLTIRTPGFGDVWTEWTRPDARQIRDALTAWLDSSNTP